LVGLWSDVSNDGRHDDRQLDVSIRPRDQLAEIRYRLIAEDLRHRVSTERAITLELRFAEPLVAGRLVRESA
jgi:hypothetical protein